MNANTELENQLQQLGRALKARTSIADRVLVDLNLSRTREPSKERLFFGRSFVGVLSAAACTLLVVSWLMFHGTGASRAFAQVKKAVRDMQSAVIQFESKSQPEMNMKVYLLDSGQWRQEFADGLVRIYSPTEERILGLDPESNVAWFSPREDTEDAWHPIRRILEAQESAVRRLDDRERDGVSQLGFLLSEEEDPVRVELWVDSTTGLPVEVRESPATPGDAFVLHRQAVYRFEFNEKLEQSLFGMTPPTGFQVVQSGPLRPVPAFPRGIDTSKLTLQPGIGIGELRWGADLAAVTSYFGPADELLYCYDADGETFYSREKLDGVSIDYYLVRYPALGLELRFRENAGLYWVSAEEGEPTLGERSFPGKTQESLAIGASLKDIKEAYGTPTRSRGPSESPFAVIYGDKGVAFVLAEGRVTAIVVNKPDR